MNSRPQSGLEPQPSSHLSFAQCSWEPVADDAARFLSYKPLAEIILRATAASPRTRASTPSGSFQHGEVAASIPLGSPVALA
jgi:hypothetical protein